MRLKKFSLIPGIVLCLAVTGLAFVLQEFESRIAGQTDLEALVLAILIGVAIRTAWRPGPAFCPGIHFSAKTLLDTAVVLLGASVSVGVRASAARFTSPRLKLVR